MKKQLRFYKEPVPTCEFRVSDAQGKCYLGIASDPEIVQTFDEGFIIAVTINRKQYLIHLQELKECLSEFIKREKLKPINRPI